MEANYNFTSNFLHSLDSKGRVILPSKYRSDLKDKKIYLITGIGEKCLYILPDEVWQSMINKITKKVSLTDKKGQMFLRFITSRAYDTKMDKQGRIFVPTNLREYANLKKDVVIVGVVDRIEIWDKNLWDEKNSSFDMNEMTTGMVEYGI